MNGTPRVYHSVLILPAAGLAVVLALGPWRGCARVPTDPARHARAAAAELPLHFVANRGQWAGPARFVVQRGPMTAWFGTTAWMLDVRAPDPSAGRPGAVAVRMSFEGASADARLEGETALPGLFHFFRSHDPAAWRTGIQSFASIVHRGLYPGVDVRAHGDAGDLEYDLQLAPGADLAPVAIRCEGIERMTMDAAGDLVLETALGPIRQAAPTTWEVQADGARRPIACRYRLLGNDRFGFDVAPRDDRLALVIDPVLKWSTFLGGVNNEIALSIVLDPSGDVIVAGGTGSRNYPATAGAYDPSFNGTGFDSIISRLSADGSTLVWSTFLGGSLTQYVQKVVRESTGDFAVTGITDSLDFPVTAGAYDTTYNGGNFDAFVSRLSADGSRLLYSSYLGGISADWTVDMDVDASGHLTVVGCTSSTDFPTTPGAFDRTYNGGPRDAFVTTLSLLGRGPGDLLWSTYLGGSGEEGDPFQSNNPHGMVELHVVADASGTTTVAGRTDSADFPVTAGAYDTSYNGGADVFVARLGTGGSSLLWATFWGGSLQDGRAALAVDRLGCPIVAGFTNSSDAPTTTGAFSPTFGGGMSDAYVFRLDPTGSALLYATYLGGPGTDELDAIAVDGGGTVTVFGHAEAGFPTTPGAYRVSSGGMLDGVIARLRTDGSGSRDLRYSTYFGGSLIDHVWRGAWDGVSAASFAGPTQSTDLPPTSGAWDTTHNGALDIFVARLELLPAGISVFGASSPGCSGSLATGVSSMPQVGNAGFAVNCTNAPPAGGGALVLGLGALASPIPVLGIDFWLDPLQVLMIVTAVADPQGYSEVGLAVPPDPSLVGGRLFGQFAWPSPCGAQGLSASNGIEVTGQG